MHRRLHDILPTRRDALRWGGLALAGTSVDGLVWPLRISAQGKSNPRGTARNCIFIELGGAISPMDCWDFKETRWTPKDLDVTEVSRGLYMSQTLFPQLSKQMQRVALVRSLQAPELIHFNGQYHTQTGRSLNPAVAREIPAFGSVVAYELAAQRRETDSFPTYVSTNLTKARAGSIGSGLLPTWATGLDLDPSTVFAAFGGDMTGANQVMEERWRLLTELARINEGQRAAMGQRASDYQTFYDDAHKLLNDARWPAVFQASAGDKQRYGDDEFGLGCILARNLLGQKAGTRMVYIYDGDRWDHHAGIFDKSAEWNHYRTCTRLDKGLVSLLDDLAAAPGHAPGKSLLDETLVVAQSEFGRTPGMNPVAGRDHYKGAYAGLYAGGGVAGGRVLGKTDADGSTCLDSGWRHKSQPFMDNTVATIYSALGIDWKKTVTNTPSGRDYAYVDTVNLGGAAMMESDEIGDLSPDAVMPSHLTLARLALCGAVILYAVLPSARVLAQAPQPPAAAAAAASADGVVVVPAGEFWMGRTRLWLMDEIGWQLRERFDDRPVHRVRLAAYAIGAHEVTNADYAAFAASVTSGVEPPYHWGGKTPPPGKERLPVYNVTWFEAVKYCASKGQRLPTEAEWERAARGDVADLDYPWGNDYVDEGPPAPKPAGGQPGAAPEKPVKRAHSGSSTGPVAVGSYPANPLGLYDMSGNLWEWTADWYDLHYYSESPVDNPTGPVSGLYKVIRGGSWADGETRLGTVYYRNFTAPATAQPTIGFRCAGAASR